MKSKWNFTLPQASLSMQRPGFSDTSRQRNSWTSLPLAMKLRQGNVFTPVCHSVHRGVSVPACTTGHMTRGVSVQGISVWESLSRWVETPGQKPPYRNEWAVCILLECILVSSIFSLGLVLQNNI